MEDSGGKKTATQGVEEGIVCAKDGVKNPTFCFLWREVHVYKALHKTDKEYSTLYADRNASFYSLTDTVVPNTAKTARIMDTLVMNEQLVKGGESRIQQGQLAWVLENAKQLTLRLRRAIPAIAVTVMPPCWDSRVILGCQEYCKNLQVAKLKFSHMLPKSKSLQGQILFFHVSLFQLSITVILTLALPDIYLCVLNTNTMYYNFRVLYSTEAGQKPKFLTNLKEWEK